MTDNEMLLERIDRLECHLGHRSIGSRVWEVLMKITVPLVMAAGAAIVTHEVRLGKIEQALSGTAPYYLIEGMQEIKGTIKTIDSRIYGINDRLIRIETKLERGPH